MSAAVVTDQRWAPLFSAWLAEQFKGEVQLDPASTRFIAYLRDDQIVTVIALSNWRNGSVELTVAIDNEAPRKGSRALVFTMFDYAFNYGGKSCITCYSRTNNSKSHVLQERLGFTRQALIKDFYGENDDAYLYTLTKREWLAGPWAQALLNRTGQQERQ